MKIITPEELVSKLETENALVLDVRAQEKYEINPVQHENIENIHIPKTDIFNTEGKDADSNLPLPNNKEIIVTCTTGNSARKCATILEEKGYQVTLLEGGVTAWESYHEDNKKAD